MFTGEYEQRSLSAVFSSLEKAKDWLEARNVKNVAGRYDQDSIDLQIEYLDEPDKPGEWLSEWPA